MKNYGLKPHKLGDKIVLDGIDAINKLQHETGLPGFISGGMAVSSYLPIENHRETVDLDYTLFFNGGVLDYKKITEHLTRTLIEKDYSIEYRKKGTTHDYLVKRHEDSLLIQHPRKSSNHFIKNKKSLEREICNRRIISDKDISYAVLSPEDLVLHKLNRVLKFHTEYNVAFPKNISQEDFKKQIESFKEEVLNLKDSVYPRMVAKLRLFYDIFDIKSLGKSIGLNKNYFEEALKDWSCPDTMANNFINTLDKYEIRLD